MEQRSLPPWIRCPFCKGALEPAAETLRCGACRRVHPIRDGIADLRIEPRDERELGAREIAARSGPSATAWARLAESLEIAGYPAPARGRFLDWGASSPELLREALARFDEVVTLSESRAALVAARDRLTGGDDTRLHYVLASAPGLPIASRCVRCFHLDAPTRPVAGLDTVLEELHRVLEPEGIGLGRYRMQRWPGDGRQAAGLATRSSEVARASRHAFQDGHRILAPGSRLRRWLPARWEPPRMLQALVQFEYSSRRRGSPLASVLRSLALRLGSRAEVVYERVRGDTIDWIQPTTSDDPFSFGRFYHAGEEVPGSP